MRALQFLVSLAVLGCTRGKEIGLIPPGSEHFEMPPVLSFSIHMGRQSSKYLRLTVESMKRNPHVQFVLINVVVDVSPTTGPAVRAVRLSKYAPNFHVVIVSLDEFKRRCNNTLGINLPVTNETAHIKKYAYKMAEYKPTLPLLFPEQFSVRDTTGKGFPFWAYTDLDIIWGNISHFAQLFQGQYDVISTDSVRLMGMATFYKNEDWTRRIVLTDKKYLENLNDFEHHYCSDEFGQCLVPAFEHSMHTMTMRELKKRHRTWNMPQYQLKNKFYSELESSMEYYGPVLWFQGTMKILNGCGERAVHKSEFQWDEKTDGCPEFEPGREIMFFHRAHNRMPKAFDIFSVLPRVIARDLIEDMLTYGFLLPNFTPIFSRHICPDFKAIKMRMVDVMNSYSPFKCFGSDTNFSRTLGLNRRHGSPTEANNDD